MYRLSASIDLDHVLRHLIDVRASQLNGCAFCRRHALEGRARRRRDRGAALDDSRLGREPAVQRP
ncbi:MAG: carboxymuconolactone decarboxylase family protein [Solirubrobacteraceae bacterium]